MRRQDAACDSEETGSSILNKLKTLQQEVPYKIKDRETWEQLSLFPENKENSQLWLQSSLSCDWPSTQDTPQFLRLTCQEHLIHELRSQMTDLHLTGSRPITFHLDGNQRFPSLWHSQKIWHHQILSSRWTWLKQLCFRAASCPETLWSSPPCFGSAPDEPIAFHFPDLLHDDTADQPSPPSAPAAACGPQSANCSDFYFPQ